MDSSFTNPHYPSLLVFAILRLCIATFDWTSSRFLWEGNIRSSFFTKTTSFFQEEFLLYTHKYMKNLTGKAFVPRRFDTTFFNSFYTAFTKQTPVRTANAKIRLILNRIHSDLFSTRSIIFLSCP